MSINLTINSKKEFLEIQLMQELFPNLYHGLKNGINETKLAKNIKEDKERTYFKHHPQKKLRQYVAISITGGDFQNNSIPPKMEEEDYRITSNKLMPGIQKIHKIKKNNFWKDEERKFILELYKQQLTHKQIFQQYSNQPTFTQRNLSAITEFITAPKNNKGIKRNRINWGNLKPRVIELLKEYKDQRNYLKTIANILNQEEFNGNSTINNEKLRNYCRREEIPMSNFYHQELNWHKKEELFNNQTRIEIAYGLSQLPNFQTTTKIKKINNLLTLLDHLFYNDIKTVKEKTLYCALRKYKTKTQETKAKQSKQYKIKQRREEFNLRKKRALEKTLESVV